MPRACSVCIHPECPVINSMIRDGNGTARELARKFGVTKSAVSRHKEKCLGFAEMKLAVKEGMDTPVRVPRVRDLPQTTRFTPTLLDDLLDIRDVCIKIRTDALMGYVDDRGKEYRPDPYLALKAASEQTNVIITMGKLFLVQSRREENAEEKAAMPEELTNLIESILA